MIRVEVPEHNTFVEFPDGLDPAEIEKVLAKNFPDGRQQFIEKESANPPAEKALYQAGAPEDVQRFRSGMAGMNRGSRQDVMGIATPTGMRAAKTARSTVPRLANDAPKLLAMGVDNVGVEAGQALDFLGAHETGQAIKDVYQKRQEETAKTLDPETQRVQNIPVYDESTGEWNTDVAPEKFLTGALQSVPDMAVSIIPSTMILSGLTRLKSASRVASILQKMGAGEKVSQYVGDFLTRGVAGGAVEGIQAGLGNSAQTEQKIRQAPLEQLQALPAFRDAYDATDTALPTEQRVAKARETIANKAALDVFLKTIPSTGGLGILTGGGATGMLSEKLAGRVAAKEVAKDARRGMAGFLKNTGEGFAEEALQEGLQSPSEQYIQNVAEQKYLAPDTDLMSGVINSSVEGAGSGGLMGLAGGGGSHLVQRQGVSKVDVAHASVPGGVDREPFNDISAMPAPSGPLSAAVNRANLPVPVATIRVTPRGEALSQEQYNPLSTTPRMSPEQIQSARQRLENQQQTGASAQDQSGMTDELLLDQARQWARGEVASGNTQHMRMVGEKPQAYDLRILGDYKKRLQAAQPAAARHQPVEALVPSQVEVPVPLLEKFDHDQLTIDSATEHDRENLLAARERAKLWTPGNRINGPSNKMDLFPWLTNWGRTTPAEVANSIDAFLTGRKLGPLQKQLVAEAIRGEQERVAQETSSQGNGRDRLKISAEGTELGGSNDPVDSELLRKALSYAEKAGNYSLEGFTNKDLADFVESWEEYEADASPLRTEDSLREVAVQPESPAKHESSTAEKVSSVPHGTHNSLAAGEVISPARPPEGEAARANQDLLARARLYAEEAGYDIEALGPEDLKDFVQSWDDYHAARGQLSGSSSVPVPNEEVHAMEALPFNGQAEPNLDSAATATPATVKEGADSQLLEKARAYAKDAHYSNIEDFTNDELAEFVRSWEEYIGRRPEEAGGPQHHQGRKASNATVKPIVAPELSGVGAGSEDYSVLMQKVQGALADANFDRVKTAKGLDLKLVHVTDNGAQGLDRVLAFDNGGNLVGDLEYSVGRMEDGRGYNPNVWVEPSARRQGVATALYNAAEARGGAIPALDQTGQLRSDEGQAFRVARERHKQPADLESALDAAAHEAASSPTNETPEPTTAQIEAGNYKKGHVRLHGLDIAIENPAGSVRRGVDQDGQEWETELAHHYGYIKGTIGRDKDHIDVFIGPDHESDRVFVVDQVDPKTGKLDEHKVLLGFQTGEQARAGYLANYDASGPERIGALSESSVAEFKHWLEKGNNRKAYALEETREVLEVQEQGGDRGKEVPDVRPEVEGAVLGSLAGPAEGEKNVGGTDHIPASSPSTDSATAEGPLAVSSPAVEEKRQLDMATPEKAEVPLVKQSGKLAEPEGSREPGLPTKEAEDRAALFTQGEERGKSILTDVEFDSVFKRVTAGLTDAQRAAWFTVAQTFDELPLSIKAEAYKQGSDGNDISGVFHRGRVYLVRDRFATEKWLEEVILHEWHGHAGLKGMFGEDITRAMLELYNAIGGARMFTIGKKYGINLMQYGHAFARAGYDTDTIRSLHTEEMLAHLTNVYSRGLIAQKIKELIGRIRAWLREHGFVQLANYNEADIAWLLKRAKVYAESGAWQNNDHPVFINREDLMKRLQERGIGDDDLQHAVDATPNFATAWHGSPHRFNKFSTRAIGTGEGNQSYGYGLYFASQRTVADFYRDVLSKNRRAFDPELVDARAGLRDALGEVDDLGFDTWQDAVQAIRQHRQDWSGRWDVNAEEAAMIDRFLTAYEKRLGEMQGHLYQVELAPEEEEYLLWDKPLSQQSMKVQDILEAAGYWDEAIDGRTLYNLLKRQEGGERESSEHLHSLGIRGIKYLDGISRGEGAGTHNYVIFAEEDAEVRAMFALNDAKERLEPVAARARANWKAILNPLDWSRSAQFFDDWTPTSIKSGFGWAFAAPHFEAQRVPSKKPFVAEGAEREINRMALMLQFFGYAPGGGAPRSKVEQFKDFFTKWHAGQESTAWEALNQRYAQLSNSQREAINILAVQGDIHNVDYKTLLTAMMNPKVKASGLAQETFDLYRDIHDHMESVSSVRADFTKEMMERAGISEERIEDHIAGYRQETKEVHGWLSRNHGNGDFATNVYHVVEALPFKLRDIAGDAQQAFLPFYPGNHALAMIKSLAGDAVVTLTGKGQVIITAKEGHRLTDFMEKAGQIIPQIGTQRVKVYVRYHMLKGAARKHAEKVKANLQAAMPENFILGERYEVTHHQIDILSEELYQNMKSDMSTEAVLQKSFEKAFNSGELSKGKLAALHSQLVRDTAEILLGRAAGKYQIRRAPYLIEGYDTRNLMEIYQDYMTSVAGMLSKADYARKQFEHLKGTPVGIKHWAYKYVFDSLRNMGAGDRVSGNARAFVSLWYMGLRPATALINATQIYTLGVAELGKLTRGSATVILGKAQRDVFAGKLSADEQMVFDSAVIKQQEAASAMAQITGHNEGGSGKASRLLQDVTGKAMALFQNVEITNRKTMILAAYRSLRDPQIPPGLVDEQALQRALEINNNVNFDQGRHNLPGWARNPTGHTFYALQSFTWNTFNWLYNNLTSGQKQDQIALLRYAGMVMLFGGAGALAGGDELDKLYLKLRGKSLLLEAKEWTRKHAKDYGALGELADAFAWHGLGGTVGVNISNSMRLQIPVVSQVLNDATLPEAFSGVFAGILKKVWASTTSLAYGDYYRATESAAPEAIAGAMKAYRQYQKGGTTLRGVPVFDEHGRPLKYSAGDAALRVAGFQPLEQSRRTEASVVGKDLREWWKHERGRLLARFRQADKKDRREVRLEIWRFNRDLRKSQAFGPVHIIKGEDMEKALAPRPDKAMVKWLQGVME